ncbi:MAG TPA: permease [Acidimicrobiales bacterium]|jgi:uncharacterized membrane protein YraQ (UPF0718 family)|nr:permease [Acidimicrobiales bacterium]
MNSLPSAPSPIRRADALPGVASRRRAWWYAAAAVTVFIIVAVVGTYLVKWHPYWHKAFTAASTHSLGASAVSGHGGAAPGGWHAALSYARYYALDIWPALLVGLLVAAGVQELLPRDWLLRALGRAGWRSTAVAGLASVPSMMCTCCSAPTTVSLARSRASVGATMAYWLGNPVINPATIVFMAFVLGWRWAVLRIVVGLALVLGVATMAERLFGEKAPPEQANRAVAQALTTDPRPLAVRYVATLGRLCIGLLPEYAVIVLGLGAARALFFPAMSPAVGHTVWLVLVLAVTGTLFVIPTAGEIPIIQTFMTFGLGAAGAGALMITLPALSLPSLAMVGRSVPAKVLAFVAGMVVLFGLLTAGLAVAMGL